MPAPAPQPVPEPLPSLEETPCPECGGSGQVTTTDWVPYGDGNVPLEQTWQCEVCEGSGLSAC